MSRTAGRLKVEEAPDSPNWNFGDVDTCVRTFTGPYADLLAMRPARGATMDGMPLGITVQTGALVHKPGNMGVLTIQLVGTTENAAESGPLSEVVEIDWVCVEKPLASHPMFQAGGSCEIDAEGWAMIESWRSESDYTLRALFCFGDPDDPDELGANEIVFCQELNKGLEAYTIYAPIVRQTGSYRAQPATGSCGAVETPNVDASIPSGYEWMKTAHRSVQQPDKSWQLIEEWTGADKIDDVIYPVPSAPSQKAPGRSAVRIPASTKRPAKKHRTPSRIAKARREFIIGLRNRRASSPSPRPSTLDT